MHYVRLPPVVAIPAPLFRKAYIDTMLMPKAQGFRYIIHARCSLISYPEWRMLRAESTRTVAAFLFEDILCRWGALEEIVTDNAPVLLAAVEFLRTRYHVHPITISPYNHQAAGLIERRHREVREAIMKTCEGDESKWPAAAPSVFWAERVTTQRSTGYSPYFMAHGVEPLLPFDLAEATYLTDWSGGLIPTPDLLAARARQLQKREDDLELVKDRVFRSRMVSAREFEEQFRNTIHDYDFKPGSLVLVRNSRTEMELNRKTKPQYLGPMAVVRRRTGGSYILAELDGSLSKLRYAAFRLLPYFPRSHLSVPVTRLVERSEQELDMMTHEEDPDGFPVLPEGLDPHDGLPGA
jgi:hypothetical protein